MKKFVSTLIILTMTASLFACGKSSSDGSDETSVAGNSETGTVASEQTSDASDWTQVLDANSESLTYMSGFDNETYGISVGYSGQIKYTNDGGKTWNDGVNDSFCRFGVTILPDGVGYTCGNAGHVTKTTDGGKTWTRMADFGDYEPNQCRILSFIDADTGFIASKTRLAVTTDGAKTWTELTAPDDIIGLRFVSEKECYIIGGTGTVYISSDLGKTWTNASFTLPDDIELKNTNNSATINVKDGEIEFFCNASDGLLHIFCSTDNGSTWNEESIPAVEKRSFLYLSQDGNYLTVNDSTGGKYTVLKNN